MGIQGLLPLLKPIHKQVSISEFSGQTVGIDTYCWLHKGAYGCATEIVEGKKTKVYLNYVLKRLDMLLFNNVKPYLVLDGGHLPSKANKEEERRRSRQEYKTKGLALLRAGNKAQAYECFQKCVDITPEMALEVIKACRERNIDYIVAPYEADAQLAYLMKTGITQATVSEDSDLLVYGCNKVIFKMDECGMGTLVDLTDLPKLADLRMHEFTMEKFKQMCILSGCDYLPSIKGVGLKTANKLIRKHSTIEKLVRGIRLENKLKVPVDYEKNFQQAYETFLYQLVFDPRNSSIVPLTPLPDGTLPGQLNFAGPMLPKDKAIGIAVGNINPITGEVMDDYNPDNNKVEEPPSIPDIPSTCAFSFGNKHERQSLTPSSLESLHVSNKSLDKGSSLGHCRRFLLPPLKKADKEKEEEDIPDDKDLMNMYTLVKRKQPTSLLKRNRVLANGCGINRKPRLKNPFRAKPDNDEPEATGQISCYFNTEDVIKPMKQDVNQSVMDVDDDMTALPTCIEKTKDDRVNRVSSGEFDTLDTETPCLPSLKYNETDTNDVFEADKENSPTAENTSPPMPSLNIFTYNQKSVERGQTYSSVIATERMDDSSLPVDDSQRSSSSDSSTDISISAVTNNMKGLLNFNTSQNNIQLPTSRRNDTPTSAFQKFTYQPKLRTKIESSREDALNDGGKDSLESLGMSEETQEVIDSGYLSDEEESTDADTPSVNGYNQSVQKDRTTIPLRSNSIGDIGTSKRPIHLKNLPTMHRTTGLSRCKSLGISKRKLNTKNTESCKSTLFNYFEFNKNKRARLESS